METVTPSMARINTTFSKLMRKVTKEFLDRVDLHGKVYGNFFYGVSPLAPISDFKQTKYWSAITSSDIKVATPVSETNPYEGFLVETWDEKTYLTGKIDDSFNYNAYTVILEAVDPM